jgi:hypothetical protein
MAAGSDSVFIVWNDLRSGDYDSYLQLITLSGAPLFGSNGIPAVSGSGRQEIRYITEGNPVEVIIAIEDRSGPMRDLYLQKVNSVGEFPWEHPVYVSSPADSETSFDVALTSDGAGGAVVSWRQYRSDTGDFYAQHVDSGGSCVWDSGGIDLSLSPYNQEWGPHMCSDTKGGAIVVWAEERPGDDWGSVFAQRIGDILCGDADGNGAVTSADGYWILNYLGVGPPPVSTWAGNVNGDGQITPADGYQLLNWLGSSGVLDCQLIPTE